MNNEFIALASAIGVGNEPLTPFVGKVIHHAPESFADPRAGPVGVTVRAMRADGEPVNFLTVGEKHLPLLTFIGAELAREERPLSDAEFYAEKCWKEFQARKIQSIFAEAHEQTISHPEQVAAIAEAARFALATVTDQTTGLPDRLTARLYSPQVKLIEPETRFQLGSVPICTPGNLTTLSAQAKAGKSAAVGAMIASTFASFEADCLGFTSKNPHGFAVVHIDTEQCPFDHQKGIERAEHRAGAQAAPDWLRSYCVTGFSAPDVRESIRILIEDAKTRFGGVHSVLIDGTADGAIDVNDPGESSCFVAELHDLAIRFYCPIINIIHVNPGSDFKTRGHLGSQLERKSETNLRLEKDGDGVTVIFADKNRRAPIPKSTGPRFAWSDEHQMHMPVQSIRNTRDDLERYELKSAAIGWFAERPSMRRNELESTVKSVMGVSDKTAERKVTSAVNLGVIKKSIVGLYVLST